MGVSKEIDVARPAYPVAIIADETPLRRKASIYPEPFADDDLKALMVDGRWKFVHKDGSPY